MTSVAEFLSHLYDLKVKIWIDDGHLRCKVPENVATPTLRAELTERKPEIIAFLSNVETAASSAAPRIQPVSRTVGLPLSFAQQRLWFIDQWEPGNPYYNVPFARRLSGPFDVTAMAGSINEIIRRHEALRTTFGVLGGQPVQVVVAMLTVPLPVVDLQELPPVRQEAEARRLATEEAQWSFDLERGPLLRATVLRMGQEQHVLLLNIHHIVFDGWSRGIFIQELAELYQAFVSRKPSPLPELPIQYADFAVWQREWLRDKVLESQLAYWKGQLEDAAGALKLPTDRPRPVVQTFQGSTESLMLSEDLTTELQRLSQGEGSTLFMTLLAAFNVLLYRYTGQPDVVVGSPIANRNRSEVEGLIGFFVNTLVLRTDLSGNPTFRELLGRVRGMTLAAYAHQDLPFEKLVEEVQPERDMGRSPLFQVMFALQNAPREALELPGLTLSPFKSDYRSSKFDLTLFVTSSEGGLRATLEYNTDLFDPATMMRLLKHFQVLLEGIVANPDQRLSDLPLLTAAERHQLLVEWNDTVTEYPRDRCIHQLFEAQVEQTPSAVGVVFKDDHLTYSALNQCANRLAHHLQALGVGSEVLVGICVERSLEMIMGILGILKAGGAYLPLDPTDPKERLAFILKDTQAPLVLTQKHLIQSLPECGAQKVCLDGDCKTINEQSSSNPYSGARSRNLAYLMYTSGSTGRPKGVGISHQSVARLVKETNYADLSKDQVVLQFAPLSFDASTFEIWGPLLNGGRLVVFPAHTPDIAELASSLKEFRITTLWLTAGLFHLMVDERLEDLGQLRQLLAGGDVLSVPHVRRILHKLNGKLRLINGYGPTENTTFTCCYPIIDARQVRQTVSIGRPIANTTVYVLDPHLRLVPVGMQGELCTGGDGLARGYLDRPKLTAEKFVPNPFSDEPGARLYKTGDLARYLLDGNIEFLGRIDQQVKIRGFRVELGEIEAVLSQHPAVRESVTLARDAEHGVGDKRLVSYIVPVQEPAPTISELRNFLKERLPEYMVPSVFLPLDALPLTPNGKVDRRALPAPEGARPKMGQAFVASRTPTEEVLAGIWAQVLGIERVGIYDNFFDLGGHSLIAIQVVSRTRDTFQIELPLSRLFETPTVAGVAQSIDDHLQMTPSATISAITSHRDFEEIEL